MVRAMHLDLTGRPIPPGGQVEGRGLRVENLDLPALWAYRARSGAAGRRPAAIAAQTELAWLAIDDPLPAAAAAAARGLGRGHARPAPAAALRPAG